MYSQTCGNYTCTNCVCFPLLFLFSQLIDVERGPYQRDGKICLAQHRALHPSTLQLCFRAFRDLRQRRIMGTESSLVPIPASRAESRCLPSAYNCQPTGLALLLRPARELCRHPSPVIDRTTSRNARDCEDRSKQQGVFLS